MIASPLILAGCGLAGLVFGSFAVTAGIRMARREQAWAGRSRCDECQVGLGFTDSTPLLSYALARGRCRRCGASIDPLHLVGEIAGAGVMVAAAVAAPSLGQVALLALLGLTLLTALTVDARSRRLPDSLTAAVAGLALALAFLRGDLMVGLACGGLAFGLVEAVRRAFRASTGKAGLGFGDVKLISALAIWLGPQTPLVIAIAAAAGLLAFGLFRPSDPRLPFGPFIGVAGFGVGVLVEAGLLDQWRGLP